MKRVFRIASFALFYLGEILKSNFRVAIDVLSPKPSICPAIVAVPIEGLSQAGVTLLADLISMTPGTLSLEYEPEAGTLYIHSMYAHDPDAFVKSIKQDYERRIQAILEK